MRATLNLFSRLELDRRSTEIENVEVDVKPSERERNEDKDRPSSREPNQRFQVISPIQSSGESPSQETSRSQQSPVDQIEHSIPVDIVLDEKLVGDATPETRRKVFREAFNQRINRNSQVMTVDNGDRVLQSTPVESYNPVEKPRLNSMYNLTLFFVCCRKKLNSAKFRVGLRLSSIPCQTHNACAHS